MSKSDTPVLYRTVTWDNGDTYHFGSVDDGEYFVELNRVPTQQDREEIETIIAGVVDLDTGRRQFPIRLARRYFSMPNGWESTDALVAPESVET